MEKPWRHFVDAEWVHAADGATLKSEDPATAEIFAEVACAGAARCRSRRPSWHSCTAPQPG
jgi:acyl-CoA reductase-like NAD-dependent aldehyde dehydrogenase